MKYLKYSLAILLVAVIFDFALTNAAGYLVTPVYGVTPHFKKNDHQWTEYITKTKNGRMSYTNDTSITYLTNPCPKCEVSTAIHIVGNQGAYSTVTTTMGQTKEFNDSVIYPRDYQMEYWRKDWTLLETFHTGRWNIQPM